MRDGGSTAINTDYSRFIGGVEARPRSKVAEDPGAWSTWVQLELLAVTYSLPIARTHCAACSAPPESLWA